MKLHLVDGTYELFRAFFGPPPARAPDGREVGAVRGLMRSMAQLLGDPDVTHVAVAFDTVIESFRNELFDGYKTGEGLEPRLKAQFPLAEAAMEAMGLRVFGMVTFEADDAIASAAARWRGEVEQVVLCSPDKDLAQCVRGAHVVLRDRMRRVTTDEDGVRDKFGVSPRSIPDYLALVGDNADGIPGIPRWGAKSTAAVLAHYERLEAIPDDAARWEVAVRGAKGLAANLATARPEALLYRTLATLREDVPLEVNLDDLRWRGPRADLEALVADLGARPLALPEPRR
ncbi:MAG: 5'-3' exonuclease H3TH domain-containing protein [Myxococcota bacterium]